MDAVILAGGLGTRLRPLTYTRPKPLLPVANRPMLQWVLDRFPPDVERIVVPLNYLRQQIEAHFAEHPDPRLDLVEEREPLGTGGAIRNVSDRLDGPFFVYNADIVSSVDLRQFADRMRSKQAQVGVTLWPVDEPWHFGVVDLAEDGRIRKFVEKPAQGQEPSNMINAGQYYLEPGVVDQLELGAKASIEREVYEPMAAGGGAIYGFPFDGYWVDCGRPETLLEANRVALAELGKARIEGDDCSVGPGASFEGLAMGDGCRLSRGARVAGSVLLPYVEVGAGAQVVDCVLGEGVVVEDGASLSGCVVGDGAIIEEGTTIRSQAVGLKPEHVEA